MKLTKTAHKTIFGMLLILGLLLPVLMNVSKADNGPKPSITINVKNGPQAYYIALRGSVANFDDIAKRQKSRLKEKYPDEKEQQAIDKIFSWGIHITPVGTSCYRGGGSGSYRFGYKVPKTFCVVMVTLDGDVIISDDVTKERYNAVFEYDVSTGELRELIKDSRMLYAKGAASCYILTLLLEGILLIPFGFASKKRNWMHFLIANSVFQGCSSLSEVELPKEVEVIGDWAFDDCSPDFVLRVYKDSEAESYAKENKLQYEYIE